MSERPNELIHDWNLADSQPVTIAGLQIEDHTLEDGLRTASAHAPALAEREGVLEAMASLGTTAICLREDLWDSAPRIRELGMRPAAWVAPADARRATEHGLEPRVVVPVSAPALRERGQSLDDALRAAEASERSTLVAEDATRAHPASLRRLVEAGVRAGAERVCLHDSCGHATPEGAARIVRFALAVMRDTGAEPRVDWYGRNDRDLAVINALSALEAGAGRIHGSVLGVGERAGGASLDLVLVNLRLLGWIEWDLTGLQSLCDRVAHACGLEVPVNYPVFGKDAFRTATGVHAAAIIKAQGKGHEWLADRVYSGVPASWFGRCQVIEVGPMSGESNVVAWLAAHDVENLPGLSQRILQRAKAGDHILTLDEIEEEIRLARQPVDA